MSGIYGPTDDAESVATIHAAIDSAILVEAVAGTRYEAMQMRNLDSEK